MLTVITIAVVGYVFSTFLIEPGMVFDFWGNFISRIEDKKPKLYKVLGGCSLCVSGQIALWYFVLSNTLTGVYLNYFLKLSYLIGFVSLVIFAVSIIGTLDEILDLYKEKKEIDNRNARKMGFKK